MAASSFLPAASCRALVGATDLGEGGDDALDLVLVLPAGHLHGPQRARPGRRWWWPRCPAAVATWGALVGFAVVEMVVLPGAQAASAWATNSALFGPSSPHAVRAVASATAGIRRVTVSAREVLSPLECTDCLRLAGGLPVDR